MRHTYTAYGELTSVLDANNDPIASETTIGQPFFFQGRRRDFQEAAYARVGAHVFPRPLLRPEARALHLQRPEGRLGRRLADRLAAGVAFSAVGPLDRRRLVVELAPPGESAPVTGAATPLRFEVPRAPGGGASAGDVALAAAPLAGSLAPEEALEVVRLALRAEEMLGGAADIEWLLEPSGSLVLVQARPARAAR